MPDQESLLKELMPTDKSDVIGMVIRRFTEAEKFRKNYETKWDDAYKTYRQYREEKDYVWESNLYVPTGWSIIETLLPRILSSIFSGKTLVEILPREKSDEEQ